MKSPLFVSMFVLLVFLYSNPLLFLHMCSLVIYSPQLLLLLALVQSLFLLDGIVDLLLDLFLSLLLPLFLFYSSLLFFLLFVDLHLILLQISHHFELIFFSSILVVLLPLYILLHIDMLVF